MLKNRKNKRIISLFVKLLLLLGVGYFFYKQVSKIDTNSFKKLELVNVQYFILAIGLVVVNQFFEFSKWNNTLRWTKTDATLHLKLKSYFAGSLTGFLTPNFLGNFIGRIIFFMRRDRIKLTILTLISNQAQFVASFSFGVLGIVVLGFPNDFIFLKELAFSKQLFILITLIFAALYFCAFYILNIFFQHKSWISFLSLLPKSKVVYLFTQLFLSFSRHFTFSLQYFFLLAAFSSAVDYHFLPYIWQVFFWSTLIPSLWFGKLFIRESVALWILSPIFPHPEIIVLASVILWICNQSLPALIGLPVVKITK